MASDGLLWRACSRGVRLLELLDWYPLIASNDL